MAFMGINKMPLTVSVLRAQYMTICKYTFKRCTF